LPHGTSTPLRLLSAALDAQAPQWPPARMSSSKLRQHG
jgi:hypothetical protein